MQDTSEQMKQMQRDILHSKTPAERFDIGLDAINFARLVVESSIKENHAEISDTELKIAVFKRCYRGFFSAGEFEKIVEAMTAYLKSKENN